MLYSCFDKKTSGKTTKSISNQQLANDLRNSIIKRFKKEVFVLHLKTFVNAFQKIVNNSDRKPNKMWVDKICEFYNRSMKSSLEKK